MALVKDLLNRVSELKDQAQKAGYSAPNGTYTFNSREASVVATALAIVKAALEHDSERFIFGLAALSPHSEPVIEILDRVNSSILDKQCPAYISQAVDETLKQARETDPSLS